MLNRTGQRSGRDQQLDLLPATIYERGIAATPTAGGRRLPLRRLSHDTSATGSNRIESSFPDDSAILWLFSGLQETPYKQ